MGRAYLGLEEGKWVERTDSRFWMDEALRKDLDNIKRIQSKNWDAVIIVTGKERSGKSVLGMQMGWYLTKGRMGIGNFARGLDDAADKIANAKDGDVIVFDEGSTVFSSKDSMTKEGKRLIKILDVVGQKNLIFIICLPNFFDLNKALAVRRSLMLYHVYPDEEYNRGKFIRFGEKKKAKLYREGKKQHDSYGAVGADWVGKYPEFHPPFYKEYLEKVKKTSFGG